MSDLYELRVKRGDDWVLDSIYDDVTIATFEAHEQEERLAGAPVRVVRVADDKAATVMGIIYETDPRLEQQGAAASGAAPRVWAARTGLGVVVVAIAAAVLWAIV